MRRAPSRWWHAASALVFMIGAVGAPVTTVCFIIRQLAAGQEFFVPGTHSLSLEKPGKYIIWNTTLAFRDGTQRAYPDSLAAGTRIRVVDEANGMEVPTHEAMSASEAFGNTRRTSVCSFTTSSPGEFSVTVDGAEEQRLLMVRRSMASQGILAFVLGGAVSILGWLLAPAISIVVEVWRYRAQKGQAGKLSEVTP